MSPEQSAYHSDLTIDVSTGEADALLPADAPCSVTDAVDPVLRELRRRSVDPVAASLLFADEVDELSVHWVMLRNH